MKPRKPRLGSRVKLIDPPEGWEEREGLVVTDPGHTCMVLWENPEKGYSTTMVESPARLRVIDG